MDASLCLLDTTSVYFEGEGPEGLAEYGYSRDKRPDRRQLVLEVMASREEMPLGHVVALPGPFTGHSGPCGQGTLGGSVPSAVACKGEARAL